MRQRELVHYQRFGESLQHALDNLDCRNFYAFNPEFDKVREPREQLPPASGKRTGNANASAAKRNPMKKR